MELGDAAWDGDQVPFEDVIQEGERRILFTGPRR